MRFLDRTLLGFCIAHDLLQNGHGYPTHGNGNNRPLDPSITNSKATFMFSGPSQAIDATRSHISNPKPTRTNTPRFAETRDNNNHVDSTEDQTDDNDDFPGEEKKENNEDCKDLVLKQVLDEKHRNGGQEYKSTFGLRREKKFFDVNYKYNLIWSPGSIRKLFMSSFVLFATHQYINSHMSANNLAIDSRKVIDALPAVVVTCFQITSNVFLPLMASACCAIQLFINLIAGGCAGFNTFLGPARPYFISMLLYLTVKYRSSVSTATHVIRWIVALLPEVVHIWNSYQESKIITTGKAALVSGGNVHTMDPSLLRENNVDSDSDQAMTWPFRATVRVVIPAMGCVACINKIDYVLRQSVPRYRLLEASSELNSDGQKGGEASLQFLCLSEDEVGGIVEKLLGNIQQAGFGREVQIESVKICMNGHKSKR